MSKRRLTRRQAWRIQKIQDERRSRADKRSAQADQQLDDNALGPERSGLVITHYGTQVLIEAEGESKRCHFRSNLGSLVTGDRVIWRDAEPYGVVVAIEPRLSALSRPDPYGDLKTVAANIDRILVVFAPYPEPHANLIDRYLVAAEAMEIKPVLLMNKSDRIEDSNREMIARLCDLYRSLDYTVLEVSSHTGAGMDNLTRYLADFTSVFVGQSGVGKSSLINHLLPDSNLRIGDLSEKQQGTHTTTNAKLFHVIGGGHLIDSPGIREFGLWHMEPEQVIEGFVELRPLLGYCKFRDCSHTQEPGCAILQAVEKGEVRPERLASYRHILATLDQQ
ncbi:small ribosomal subunit biogenesis GTPase RsgA [Marinimicrobium alkaliphilum]|uniref:small ribosomal subunit biogenesis GTPase RsgA n=1 Tax=Marinimicrobium alkaliphilum TaxID=2202654 RepID=UPI000DB9A478|nr:small ribosomal subunit biogenesis GTPase RsgA [Marinimicrobium alkaliphilum]